MSETLTLKEKEDATLYNTTWTYVFFQGLL